MATGKDLLTTLRKLRNKTSRAAATNIPAVGAEALINGDMETGSPPTGWSTVNGGTITADADAHGGAQSLRYARVGVQYSHVDHAVTVANKTWYQMSAWVKGGGSQQFNFLLAFVGALQYDYTTSPANWTQYIATGRTTGTSGTTQLYSVAAGDAQATLFDDVSVMPLTLATLFDVPIVSASNVTAYAKITRTVGQQAGIYINLDSVAAPANFVIAYLDAGNAKLDKCVAGTYTNVISAAVTYVAGSEIRVVKSGTTYTLSYNSIAVGTPQTISDAGIISNTRHGAFRTNALNLVNELHVLRNGA